MKNFSIQRLSTLLALLVISTACALAQTLKVTGTVTDETGEPLIGVSVIEKGTSKGGITDLDGKYVIDVQSGATLTYSYIGYVTQELKATTNKINVSLKPDSKTLEDVVVVGYGVQKKSAVTGAISQVKAEDMENRTITNAQQALEGKTAGVQIISGGGSPGSAPTVRVRGYSSNVSSSPLYVVDGVRLSDISGVDPNDIASMEILKDAASAAIYGAEAGNGVVLITTKKGKAGEGKISYSFQWTDEQIARVPKLMNAEEYKNYMLEGSTFTEDYINMYWDGKTDTDWVKETFEHGHMQKHNVAFTGGGERGNYYLSLGYVDNNGIVKGNADIYKRLTATINSEYKIKNWLKVGTTNQIEKYDLKQVSSSNEYGSMMPAVMLMDPLTPAVYADNNNLPPHMENALATGHHPTMTADGKYYGVSNFYQGEQGNPLAMRDSSSPRNEGFNINGSIYGDVNIIKDLTLTSRFGYRLSGTRNSTASLPSYSNATHASDYVGLNSTSSTTIYYQWENFANYMHTFADAHTVSAMAGISFQKSSYDFVTGSLSANGEDAIKKNDPGFYYLNYASASATKGVTGELTNTAKFSYFGRVGYDYKNRYLFQASLRADAADLAMLSKKTRWGYFPAVSVGWTISEEKFFAPLKDKLNSLKFRASWGQNGSLSALGSYSYGTDMSLSGIYPFTSGNTYVTGAAPSTLGNDNLKWETSEQLNFGLDGMAFDGRMTFAIDYFNKKTKDLLVWNTTPSLIIGGATSPMNAGNVENKGFEFELGWRDKIGDFSYGIRGNLSTLDNKVTYIDPSVQRISGATFHTYTITYFEQNYPVYYFRGYKFAGVDPATGNPTFEDLDGDGQISDNDKTCIGDGIPSLTFGLTLNAAYKGFDLTVFGSGVSGNDIFMCINRPDYASANKLKEVYYDNRWTATNTTGTVPRAGATDIDKYTCSSAMIYDGSYFKIKQIQLGYTLPKSLLRKTFFSNARLYMSLDDFFTFSKYPGFDPESSANSTTGMGVDKGAYPTSKKMVFGLNIEF